MINARWDGGRRLDRPPEGLRPRSARDGRRGVPALHLGRLIRPAQPGQRGAPGPQGIPREVPGGLDEEATRLPHVVQMAAGGEAAQRAAGSAGGSASGRRIPSTRRWPYK